MNSILFFPEELVSANRIKLSVARSEQVQKRHNPAPGKWQSSILFGLSRGECLLEESEQSYLEFEVRWNDSNPNSTIALSVVVGISRPQTIKKILQYGASFGVKQLFFVKSQGVAKSYLQSKALFKENIKDQLVLGMEQGRNPIVPIVEVHTDLKECINELLENPAANQKLLIADTQVAPEQNLLSLFTNAPLAEHAVLAIGPELGWTQSDRAIFTEYGFEPFSLGANMLRTETAFSAGVAQTALFLSRA